jgi:hypothetical protein
MSRATKICIAASVFLLILLVANYRFAETLYRYSFCSADDVGCVDWRGSDISPLFGFPEDRVGGVLGVLLCRTVIASAKLFRSDSKKD